MLQSMRSQWVGHDRQLNNNNNITCNTPDIFSKKLFAVYPTFGVTGHPEFYLAILLSRLSMAWHLPTFPTSSHTHFPLTHSSNISLQHFNISSLWFTLPVLTRPDFVDNSSFWAFVPMSASAWNILPLVLCVAFSFPFSGLSSNAPP